METLIACIDGASRGNPGPAGIGILIKDDLGIVRTKLSRYIGDATNNQAEYKALIMALEEVIKLGAEHIDIRMDSELVVRQVQGSYKVKDAKLKPLFNQVKQLLTRFESFTIMHVPREQNKIADALANQAINKR
jgi:ribonuclease HI